jgi:ribosomal protein S18 acetylase RimI-like enzyme
MTVLIVPFVKKDHDCSRFDCGEPMLNRYLREQAGQDIRRHYAALFVAAEKDSGAVKGYYTLSSAGVNIQNLPEEEQNGLPKYSDVPCVRLGRLAVDRSAQGQRLGTLLVADAVIRSAGSVVEWTAMLVNAKNERAAAFYRKIGFIALNDKQQNLIIMRKKLMDFTNGVISEIRS